MQAFNVLSICVGASLGALLRWIFGLSLNSILPTFPLGTLMANLVGGFCMGVFMAVTKNHIFLSETLRLAIVTGFLGGLTTFSTFSAETITLFSHEQYIGALALIIAHLFGTLLMTLLGIYTLKFFTS